MLTLVSGCISQEPRNPASNHRKPWWGASDMQVDNAKCRQPLPKNVQELRKYFLDLEKNYLANSDYSVVQIFDLKLENQPGILVRAVYELLTPGPIFNSLVKPIQNPKKRFQIPDSCVSAVCVAEAIFGSPQGLQMLYLKTRFDLNSSPYSFDDSDPFTESELWDIISALELLPGKLLPFTLNQKLTHYSRSTSRGSVLANATMGFYDRWSRKANSHRQYVAFHEFAHKYADNFVDNLAQIDAWLKVSGWEPNPENRALFQRLTDHDDELISGYAKTNPSEDFAETVSAFRLNPLELREKSPERYAFVRDFVFDGIEFTHTEACERSPFYQRQIESGKIDATSFLPQHLAIIAKQCQPEYAASTFGHLPKSYYSSCIQSQGLFVYFHEIENRPVPRTLINEQFARSDVQIHGLEDKVSAIQARKMAKSIWKTVGFMAPFAKSKDCKSTPWTTLQNTLVEKEGISFTQKPLAFTAYAVTPHKVEMACRNLIGNRILNGFSESSILSYLLDKK